MESCFYLSFPHSPGCLYRDRVCECPDQPGAGSPGKRGQLVGLGPWATVDAAVSRPFALMTHTLLSVAAGQPLARPRREKSLKELSDFCHHWRIWQAYPKGFYCLLGHWQPHGKVTSKTREESYSAWVFRHTTSCSINGSTVPSRGKEEPRITRSCKLVLTMLFLKPIETLIIPGGWRGDIHALAQSSLIQTSRVDWSAEEHFKPHPWAGANLKGLLLYPPHCQECAPINLGVSTITTGILSTNSSTLICS